MVSIVVPVWNGEAKLDRCLDSLAKQTLERVEVVVVDDGSTDGTRGIITTFLERDPTKFVALSGPNRGLGAARNQGLAIARGDFVGFADADDFLHPWALERMVELAIRSGADLVVANFQTEMPSGVFTVDVLSRLDDDPLLMTLPAVWNKVHRRSAFEAVRFPHTRITEDFAVTPRLMLNAERIERLAEAPYVYDRTGADGLTAKMSRDPSLVFEYVVTFELLVDFFRTHPRAERYRRAIARGLLHQLAAGCGMLASHPERLDEFVSRCGAIIEREFGGIFDENCPYPEWPIAWRPRRS